MTTQTQNMQIDLKLEGRVLEFCMDLNETNTFTRPAFDLISRTLDEIAGRDDFDVLLLTSAAPGFFSNGLDPHLFYGKSESEIRDNTRIILETGAKIFALEQPTIAVISGHCMGAGSVFATFCDWRFMAEKGARFGFPEIQIAMNFPAGSGLVLQQLVGRRAARDLLFSARFVKGPEALEIGIADELHDAAVLTDKARTFARKLSQFPGHASRGIKEALNRSFVDPIRQFAQADLDNMVETILRPETQEGFLSIIERRRPDFSRV